MSDRGTALVTGATGFVGSHLAPALTAEGWQVRAGARAPDRARRQADLDWVRLDVDEPRTLGPALDGVDVAYYLIHSLVGGRPGYHEREVEAAGRFAASARAAGVERIVYLGGLQPRDGAPSRHLSGRLGVGRALRTGAPPCLELRASMIIGAGSDSFRMLRDLAARLPAMILPRWLETRTEPIAIDDVVAALVAGASVGLDGDQVFDLDGPEVLPCREILLRVAAAQGNAPLTVGVPLLTPRLSSWWVRFVTGVDTPLARELIDGLTSDLVATHRGYRALAGLPPPVPLAEAIRRALDERPEVPLPVRWWERAVHRISPTQPA